MLLSDTKNDKGPQDPFRKVYVSLKKSNEVTEKAFTKDYAPKGIPKKPHKFRQGQRWTESELKYTLIKNRLFDDIPQYPELAQDKEPLFSSFSKDKKFKPPISTKEI